MGSALALDAAWAVPPAAVDFASPDPLAAPASAAPKEGAWPLPAVVFASACPFATADRRGAVDGVVEEGWLLAVPEAVAAELLSLPSALDGAEIWLPP
uniref:hypothetical protein n=1 Tax=Acidocella sp. C78 TaxID=1671486 RepID=UPI00191B8FDB|nr:hypothetical protein [Acidocella sp. C78]